jgi:hypothetical protein
LPVFPLRNANFIQVENKFNEDSDRSWVQTILSEREDEDFKRNCGGSARVVEHMFNVS